MGYDLTAAVEAVHRAECSVEGCAATSAAERAVRAALPHLRQQIREHVAGEIEVKTPDGRRAQAFCAGMGRAARIARGEQP